MSQAEVVRNMKERAERCRRLSTAILDKQAAAALREMADQIEADIESLTAGNPAQPEQKLEPINRLAT